MSSGLWLEHMTVRRISIIQGEHAVVGDPKTVVTTVLGSCVSVCLRDPVARVGGMNHFLLGEPDCRHTVSPKELQRYGIHAMEVLINALMGRGAERSRLSAHLYGGANVLAGLTAIGSQNIVFARKFLRTEGIAIIHEDVGGNAARRIEFMPHEGKSRCSRVSHAPPIRPFEQPASPGGRSGELELF